MEVFDTSFIITGDKLMKFVETHDFINEDGDDVLSYADNITSVLLAVERAIDELIESKRVLIDNCIDFDEVSFIRRADDLKKLKRKICENRKELNTLIDDKRSKCVHDFKLKSCDPYNDWHQCNKCGEITN